MLALGAVGALAAVHVDLLALQVAAEARAPWLLALLLVPVLVAAGAVATAVFAVGAVRMRWWTPLARVRVVVVVAALLVVVTFATRYHLIGWQLA